MIFSFLSSRHPTHAVWPSPMPAHAWPHHPGCLPLTALAQAAPLAPSPLSPLHVPVTLTCPPVQRRRAPLVQRQQAGHGHRGGSSQAVPSPTQVVPLPCCAALRAHPGPVELAPKYIHSGALGACLDPNISPNSTVQKEDSPSHQNAGTCMEY
jgi:hypothetical protein